MAQQQTIRGVNLGGWLVLEKWMTPSLFEGSDAVDEFTLCDGAGPQRIKQLKHFRQTFITEDDFRWLAGQGIGAVRLPLGYWVFGNTPPYVGAIDYVDKAFAWAEKYDIKVLLCLHGAPGSQNGNDHSGRVGAVGWGTSATVQQTLEVLGRLVERYKSKPALLGFELLNEPAGSIPRHRLMAYYRRGYALVRKQCPPGTWVVFSDRFRLWSWAMSLHWPFYRQAYLDTHQYQVFSAADKVLDVAGHIAKTKRIGWYLRLLGWHRRFIVGEWSAALDPASLRGLDEAGTKKAYNDYLHAQYAAFASADAWFFWSYKTESSTAWSYRRLVEWQQSPPLHMPVTNFTDVN